MDRDIHDLYMLLLTYWVYDFQPEFYDSLQQGWWWLPYLDLCVLYKNWLVKRIEERSE